MHPQPCWFANVPKAQIQQKLAEKKGARKSDAALKSAVAGVFGKGPQGAAAAVQVLQQQAAYAAQQQQQLAVAAGYAPPMAPPPSAQP